MSGSVWRFLISNVSERKDRWSGEDRQVWDPILQKEEVEHSGFVYDLSVLDNHHNFIADGFVVSNCGMRLVRTHLILADVQPRLERLMTKLFRRVPAGVGSKGFISLKHASLKRSF